MRPVFLVIIIVVLVLAVSWDVLCLWDLAHAERVRYLPKWAWAVVCLISCPWGGLLYIAIGRKPRNRVL